MAQVIEIQVPIDEIEFVREVLRIVTDKMIEWLDFCAEEEGLPEPRDFAWTDDLAMSLSAPMFHDLALPFDQKLRFHFDGYASLHMCGKTDHLLEISRPARRWRISTL